MTVAIILLQITIARNARILIIVIACQDILKSLKFVDLAIILGRII